MDALLGLERKLAGVMNLQELSSSVLHGLHELLGAAGSLLFAFDAAGGVSHPGGSLAPTMRDYTPDLFAEDWIWRSNFTRPGVKLLHFGTEPELTTLCRGRTYQEFYQPRDIGFMCAVWPTGLRFGASHMFGLLFVTSTLSQRFTDRDYEQLIWLEDPLRAAARRMARYRGLEERDAVLWRLFTARRRAIALWQPDGRLVLLSADAQRALAGRRGRDQLEQAAKLAFRQLRLEQRAVRDAFLGRPRKLRSSAGATLVVEFSCIAGDERPWLLAELHELNDAGRALAELSPAETRVLRLLCRGLSNREIAAHVQTSSETVRTHVKHILTKLGVNSRAKAAHLARGYWD